MRPDGSYIARARGGSFGRPVGTLLLGLGALIAIGSAGGLKLDGRKPHQAIEDVLVAAGLDIAEISLTGHRHTLDSDIFAALGADGTQSLPGFDLVAARRRVEALPWVATARITRLLPDALKVEVTERAAMAVWRDGDKRVLVDATGRRLATVTAGAVPELPRISGKGAPETAASLLDALSAHPGLRSRLEMATRRGARRWTLALTGEGGSTIVHLPEKDLPAALQRLADIEAVSRLPAGGRRVVDLRRADTIAIRNEPLPADRVGEARSTIDRIIDRSL